MKILILGDGLLGSELRNQTGWDHMSRKKDGFDITNPNTWSMTTISDYDQIVNCIANTDTYNRNRKPLWITNYMAVKNLIRMCNMLSMKLVHISTDYVYAGSVPNASEEDIPIPCRNWYTYSKLLADQHTIEYSQDCLILRASFKPRPFPHPRAYNLVGNFDYVDIIAELMINAILWNMDGIVNIGTETKTILELAKRTNPEVTLLNAQPDDAPTNITMDISKYEHCRDSNT